MGGFRLWLLASFAGAEMDGLRGWATQSCNDSPCAEKVDWNCEIFDEWMAEEDAEDVEGVVAVVGESEGVDDGIVVGDCEHYGDDWKSDGDSGTALLDGGRTQSGGYPSLRDIDVKEVGVQ